MSRKLLKLTLPVLSFFLLVNVASAQMSLGVGSNKGPLSRLKTMLTDVPSYNNATDENSFVLYLGQLINVFLGILGTLFVFLMVYAGYTWMTAAGDEKKVTKAQDTLRTAIIGLIITAGVYAIWQFLFVRLLAS